jgi:ornithine cyclodeaminase
MKVLLVNEREVHALLTLEACIPLMREALATLARGDAVLPLRTKVGLPDGSGLLGLMPGYLGQPRSFGLKVVSVMPGNHGTAYDSHQGVVMLFGVEHGEPQAILDGASITAIRTAAASGAATDTLAREDAGDLALLGSGAQARTHLEAMRVVRPLRRVRVWSRSAERAAAFARDASARTGLAVEPASSAEAAVRGADLICTTTSAREPVLRGEWLEPGTHVNAVGACFRPFRELDTAAVRRARFFTDCRESCMNEAGDFLIPLEEGAIQASHLLAEVGEVFLGRARGRTAPEDVTVFESLGIALEDLASAHFIRERAIATGTGTWTEWGRPAGD